MEKKKKKKKEKKGKERPWNKFRDKAIVLLVDLFLIFPIFRVGFGGFCLLTRSFSRYSAPVWCYCIDFLFHGRQSSLNGNQSIGVGQSIR